MKHPSLNSSTARGFRVTTAVVALLTLVWGTTITRAAGHIRIVTSIPDLAEFAREIGGSLVEVESLATGVEDPHGVPMKPSFVPKLSRADLLILIGLENEHAYLPALIDASRNPRIQPGKPGYIDTSRDIVPLEVPTSLSRSEGEVHPGGNPHYNLDPELGRVMVNTVFDGMAKNFPQHEAAFKAGRDAYLAKLDARIAGWRAEAAPLRGLKFISYHNHWPYFTQRYGLVYVGTIELRHGIEPTARHVAETIAHMKAEGCKLVVREPQFSDKVPNQVAAQSGARVVTLPIMVGGVPQARTYLEMIDYNIHTLLQAAQ
jgi:zinc/manganese transport system substrate-binding protein